MSFAIITEKYSGGGVKTLRSSAVPLTPKLNERAKALDRYLSKRIPAIEKELVDTNLLDARIAKPDEFRSQGNVRLWHTLGGNLRAICAEFGIQGLRERRWLWEAIEKLYATDRIRRAGRGRTRSHFEYCYRLSQFPLEFAERVNWSEWVYFFDSRTVREEPRVDEWLMSLVGKGEKTDRQTFRRFTERLNRRVRNLDTSELTKPELFEIYEKTWQETKTELNL